MWNPIPVEVESSLAQTLRISLCLHQDALRSEGQLLGLNNAQNFSIHAQRVVGRAARCLKLGYSGAYVGIERPPRRKRHDVPTSRFQLGVNQAFASEPLGILL